jgi:putative molybdopterin biosynthesis protein
MKRIQKIQALKQIKTLADSRRMEILRLLMDEPATLSQLGEILGQSAAWVRHHIQKMEMAELVELAETRRTGKVTEKYYRARAGGLIFQEMVLPKSKKPVLIFSGSHDLAFEKAAGQLEKYSQVLSLPVGSLDGLVNLRQGLCQISGAHLLGSDGEYNISHVRHLFPDRDIELVTMAHRTQGLIVQPGNPLGIRKLSDLVRKGLRFINRNPGSGTRIWLEAALKRQEIPSESIQGYGNVAFTHNATARAVALGSADAAVGLQAAAKKFELGFIPLFDERYDLIFPREFISQLKILVDYVQSSGFRRQLSQFGGYQSASTGTQVTLS